MQPERKSYSAIDVKVIAQPRRTSAPSLSAFQIPVRGSNNSVVIHEEPKASSDRPYLIAIVVLLLGVIGVLTFLLFL